MIKKHLIRLAAGALAIAMPIMTASMAYAETSEPFDTTVKYASPNINDLTGLGQEPEELSVTAGSTYMEKAWYEYVTYSDKAVSSYRLDDDYRILFYDPYTYTNSMIMDVQFDATTTEFDTMSTYTVSKTNTKSMSACVSSTETNTKAEETSGKDYYHTDVESGGKYITTYNHQIDTTQAGKVVDETKYEYTRKDVNSNSHTLSSTLSSETEIEASLTPAVKEKVTIGGGDEWTDSSTDAWMTDKETNTVTYSDDYKTTTAFSGTDEIEDTTSSTTDGWTQLSARVTQSIGSSSSTSSSWSEEESVTVTKTYAATHFASDGVTPLPWAIVHYEVQMPMKCVMQVKHSGEWVDISTAYCMLSTVKGTCRAWMQEGQVYYEDWGNGEPVTATDFWGQFMTKEQLMDAYSNKLYPVGGEG